MRQLEDFTASQVIGYITDKVAEDKGITKALAKKLVINALCYNIVIEEIRG